MSRNYSNMTPGEILDSLNKATEQLKELPRGLPKELKVWCNDLLPPGTMVVSPDLFEQFKQAPTKEGVLHGKATSEKG